MQKLEHIKSLILKKKEYLYKKYKIKTLGIFGSFARNENREGSDVDILVDFDDAPGILSFLELENYLSDLLNCKVDLVEKDAVRPIIKKYIEKDLLII